MAKRGATSPTPPPRNVEDRLRRAASPSRYPGTIAHGSATGPDPYISDLRRKVARGEKLDSAKQKLISEDAESGDKQAARKHAAGR